MLRFSSPGPIYLFINWGYAGIGGALSIGFVLIGVEPKKDREVYQKLMKIEEVVELYPLFGDYDLIAKVEAESYDRIGEVVVGKIRTLPGVRATKTLAKISF